MTIIRDGNTLKVENSNTYQLYNKTLDYDGFTTYEEYDGIDKNKQRCKIIFQKNDNADWSTKYMIYIYYENQNTGLVYLSNEPKKIQ